MISKKNNDPKFKENDLIQVSSKMGSKKVIDGTILKLSKTKEESFYDAYYYYLVKLESGEEKEYEEYRIEKRDSEIERNFRNYYIANISKIDSLADEAYSKLREACLLSDALGIPFYSNVSELGQTYNPKTSLEGKFNREVIKKIIPDITEYQIGWEQSAIC